MARNFHCSHSHFAVISNKFYVSEPRWHEQGLLHYHCRGEMLDTCQWDVLETYARVGSSLGPYKLCPLAIELVFDEHFWSAWLLPTILTHNLLGVLSLICKSRITGNWVTVFTEGYRILTCAGSLNKWKSWYAITLSYLFDQHDFSCLVSASLIWLFYKSPQKIPTVE